MTLLHIHVITVHYNVQPVMVLDMINVFHVIIHSYYSTVNALQNVHKDIINQLTIYVNYVIPLNVNHVLI